MKKTSQSEEIMNSYEKMLAIIFILILLGELNVVIQPSIVAKTSVNLLNVRYEDGECVEVTYSIKQGTYPNILKVTLIPVYQSLIDKNLYVYYDKDYPYSLTSLGSWIGVIDHLDENVKLKGYKGKLEIVNASKLKEIMLQKYNSVLIIPSGVLPETVHTKENSIVKQYLENGGIIVWIGDVFAAYSGKQGGKIISFSPENPGLEAQEKILGYIISNTSKFESADVETHYSKALSLKYPGIHTGAFREEILKHNGLVLGKVKENRTSIGMVPVGKGFLILFGGIVTPARTVFGEDFIASDVINILLSGIFYSNGQLSYDEIHRKNVYNETLSVALKDNKIIGIAFFVVSEDYYSYFFFRQFIDLRAGT